MEFKATIKISNLVSLCIFWQCTVIGLLAGQYQGTPDIYSDEMTQKCVPFQEAFICSDVPYNHTSFPNEFGHQNLADAQSALNDFIPLININCSTQLKQFLCLVFAPPCTVLDVPLKVCRSFCEDAVTDECRKILKQFRAPVPEVLECINYPTSGLCISEKSTISDKGNGVIWTTRKPDYSSSEFEHFSVDNFIDSSEADIPLDLHLLVSNDNKLQLLQIRSPNSLDSITVFRGLSEVTAVDYYQPSQYFYWAMKLERKIFRGRLVLESLEDIRPIISVESSVTSICVDWHLDVLFWLETYPRARLRTSSLSGRQVTTLVSKEMFTPISLTLDPTEGVLFWINKRGPIFNQFSTVESYSVQSDRRISVFNISSDSVEEGGRPQALVADIHEKQLYWVDAMSKSLHVINYDGSGHRVLLQGHRRLSDPESLAVRGEHVLWTDRSTSSIVWVNKTTGQDELIVKTFDKSTPQNIKIYTSKSQDKKFDQIYDKSTLDKKWRELSSAENMAELDYDDAIDGDDYYDDDDDDDIDDVTRKKDTNQNCNSVSTIASGLLVLSCVMFNVLKTNVNL